VSREMKVFGGCYDGMTRVIVATTTKKAAFEAMSELKLCGGYSTWNEFTCETYNEKETKVALANPGVVFMERDGKRRNTNGIVPATLYGD
jgi:hypothetical protein